MRTGALSVSSANNISCWRPLFNLVIGSGQTRQNAFPFHQRLNFGHSSSASTAQVEKQAASPSTPALSGTFADLFCGIGSATMALSELGLKCVYANDNSELAASIYEKNHTMEQNFVDKRDFSEVVKHHLKEIPRANVLSVGLPTCGKKLRMTDENIRILVESLLRLIHHQRNEVIMLEFKRMKHGIKTGAYTITDFCKMLDEAGYWTGSELYSAGSFGLPQRREHIIVLAVRKDLIPGPFSPRPAERDPDQTLELKDFLLSYEEYLRLNKDRYWPNGMVPQMVDGVLCLNEDEVRPIGSRIYARRLKLQHRNPLERPPGPAKHHQHRVGFWQRISPEGVEIKGIKTRDRISHQRSLANRLGERSLETMCCYLTAGPDDGQGGVVPCIRYLHAREGARLVGLPDSFILPGDFMSTQRLYPDWHLLGMTVPPRILQWPLLGLAQDHPHLFEPGRPQEKPPS